MSAGSWLLVLCLLFIHPPAHGSEVSPAARNTLASARIPRASKLLICGLFQKVRVLAQDGLTSRTVSPFPAPACARLVKILERPAGQQFARLPSPREESSRRCFRHQVLLRRV